MVFTLALRGFGFTAQRVPIEHGAALDLKRAIANLATHMFVLAEADVSAESRAGLKTRGRRTERAVHRYRVEEAAACRAAELPLLPKACHAGRG